jgi:nitrous oxidase accessory protein NosD
MAERRLALLLGVAAVAVLALSPAAHAAAPQCGDTIKHDVTLHANLDCAASNTDGLVIGKDGVTIDLNGHKIVGPGGGAGGYYGIDDGDGHDRLTVKNGTIANYYYDVYLYGVAFPTISKVHLNVDGSHSYDGVYSEYSNSGKFLDNTSAHGDEGLYLLYGSGNLVRGNKVDDMEYGIDIEYENGSVAIKNKSTNGYLEYGMEDSENYDVAWHDNTANGGEYGFYSDYPTKVLFEGNTANNNAYAGFYVNDNDPTSHYSAKLVGNTANKNTDYGIYSDYPSKGSGNTAIGNGTYDCYYVPCNAKVAGKPAKLFEAFGH